MASVWAWPSPARRYWSTVATSGRTVRPAAARALACGYPERKWSDCRLAQSNLFAGPNQRLRPLRLPAHTDSVYSLLFVEVFELCKFRESNVGNRPKGHGSM